MSIPNVYPGPLRSLKQPGMLKTARFHQKWRKIKKTKILWKIDIFIYIYIYIYITDPRARGCPPARPPGARRRAPARYPPPGARRAPAAGRAPFTRPNGIKYIFPPPYIYIYMYIWEYEGLYPKYIFMKIQNVYVNSKCLPRSLKVRKIAWDA